MTYYPHITILPFSSIQVMFKALSNARHNGTVWQARLWGEGGGLKKVSEKEPMLYDWIFLVKILKTLENYAKENDYNTQSSHLEFSISLITDCTGNVIDNATFIIECHDNNSIRVHTNYTYYSDCLGEKIKLQDVQMIAGPLNRMSEDIQEMVEQIIDAFFIMNESGSIFYPTSKIERIYANCLSLATTI